MANRIVGLDIGTWSVKAVTIELQRELEVVDFREIGLAQFQEGARAQLTDGTVQGPDEGEEVAEAGGDEAPAAAAGEVEVYGPLEPAWAQAVAVLKEEGYFEGVTRVIASMPDGKAMTLHVEVPFERKANVEPILPHLLSDELPISVDEVIYDFIVVPGKGPEVWEALVGVAERRELARFLEEIQQAGVDPAVLGIPELMLRYAGDQAVAPGVENYGIIDLGHENTRLLIMSGGKPVVARTIGQGGAMLTDALTERFHLPGEEALQVKHNRGSVGRAAMESPELADRQIGQVLQEALRPLVRDLRLTFRSAFANYGVAVDAIYICGGTSRLRGIGEFLTREFKVPVEELRFERGLVWVDANNGHGRSPELTLALANALQAPNDRDESMLINFRQGPFAFRGKSSYLRAQMIRLGAAAAVLLVLLVGVLFMQHADQKAQLKAMQRALAEQTTELFGEPVRNPANVRARLDGRAGPDRNFVPRMSAYELMYYMLEKVSSDTPLQLERIEVDTDRNLIQLVGLTDSPQSVDTLASDIGEMSCLTEVRKDQVNVQSAEKVQFQLQITSGCF